MKIYKLGNVPESIYPFIGGKARGLDELIKKGFNVPKGFLITDINSKEDINKDLIYQIYDEEKFSKVSVRSSASNEDGEKTSNAGQFETYLFVDKTNLIESIDKCIDSLNNERAKSYNEHFCSCDAINKMNIVVMEMIDSLTAGVIFSVSPINPTKMLIEAVEGQGENLVGGLKSATQYSPSIYSFNIKGDKTLSTEKLKELYDNAQRIRKAFNTHVDIEWAIDKKELYILQVRPITTQIYDLKEFDRVDDVSTHLFTKRNVGEMMPGAVTPLTLSTSAFAIDYGMRYMMKRSGKCKRVDDIPPLHMISSWSGHLFFDMNILYEMYAKISIASPKQMNLSIMGEDVDYEVKGLKFSPKLIRHINSIRFLRFVLSGGRARKKLNRLVNRTKFKEKDDIKKVYDEISHHLRYLNKALIYHYAASSDSGSASSTLYQMLEDQFENKSEYQAFLASILTNIDNIESADILNRLQDIASILKEENKDITSYNEEELLNYIHSSKNEVLVSKYNEFLKVHGHRSIKEAELRSKAWKNDEMSLMTYLLSIISSSLTLKQGEENINLKEKFSFIKKGLLKKFAILFAKRSRQAVVNREYTKSRMIKMIDLFKDQYIILAHLLVNAHYLEDIDQIYFLTHEEIRDLINGDTSLIAKTNTRRKTFEYQQELSFDDIYVGEPLPDTSIEEDDISSCSLKGVPVCIGEVEGIVRIVNSITDAKKLHKGEIMVAKFTDIGWTPYYSNISGLVTEIGSSLSHGAVVAREYNLPTIVNVKKATKKLHNGDKIRLDASKGTISIIS